MTCLCVSILDPASQMPILVTALDIHYFSSCQKKTYIRFHYDAPNSQVPGINFLEYMIF